MEYDCDYHLPSRRLKYRDIKASKDKKSCKSKRKSDKTKQKCDQHSKTECCKNEMQKAKLQEIDTMLVSDFDLNTTEEYNQNLEKLQYLEAMIKIYDYNSDGFICKEEGELYNLIHKEYNIYTQICKINGNDKLKQALSIKAKAINNKCSDLKNKIGIIRNQIIIDEEAKYMEEWYVESSIRMLEYEYNVRMCRKIDRLKKLLSLTIDCSHKIEILLEINISELTKANAYEIAENLIQHYGQNLDTNSYFTYSRIYKDFQI